MINPEGMAQRAEEGTYDRISQEQRALAPDHADASDIRWQDMSAGELMHEGVSDIAPGAKANRREKVRRLYAQFVRLPKWKRKSAAPKVHARVSAYRRRWNLWAASLLGLSTCASLPGYAADRPIYVLSSNLPSGALLPGGDFISSGTVGPTTVTNSGVMAGDSVLNLVESASSNADVPPGATLSGVTFGAKVPGTNWYGMRVINRDLYLVPASGYLKVGRSASDYTQVNVGPASLYGLDCASRTIVGGGNAVTTCSTSWYFFLSAAYGYNSSYGYSASSGYYANWYVAWRPVGGANLTAGTVSMPAIAMWQWPRKSATRVDKPTSIVLVGLTCTLSSKGNTGSGQYTFGEVLQSSTPSQKLAGLSEADLNVTASCTGTNRTSVSVPIGYTLAPAGAATARTATGGLQDATQPSFYINFTKDGTPECNTSSANSIPVDGVTAQRITTVKAGDTMTTAQIPLAAALCSTGITSQKAGTYSMAVTASIVSY